MSLLISSLVLQTRHFEFTCVDCDTLWHYERSLGSSKSTLKECHIIQYEALSFPSCTSRETKTKTHCQRTHESDGTLYFTFCHSRNISLLNLRKSQAAKNVPSMFYLQMWNCLHKNICPGWFSNHYSPFKFNILFSILKKKN